MKTVYAIWYWHVGCPPKDGGKKPWTVRHFGSESKGRTWVSHNFYLIVVAEGSHCEIGDDGSLPECPPAGSKLLVGSRETPNHHKCGKFPVVERPIENPFNLKNHQRTVQDNWRRT